MRSRRSNKARQNSVLGLFSVLIVVFAAQVFLDVGTTIKQTFFPHIAYQERVYLQKEQEAVLEEKKNISISQQRAREKIGTLSVLSVTNSRGIGGECGSPSTWTWPCDNSQSQGTRIVNHKTIEEAGDHFSFEGIALKKEPPGLEIPAGGTSTEIIVKDPDDPKTTLGKMGYCLSDGGQFESLAIISLSQPLLPKTLEGHELSIRPVSEEEDDVYAKIDWDWFSRVKPEEFEELFCKIGVTGDFAYDQLRSADIFGHIVSSNQLGADAISYLLAKCSMRVPGESREEYVKDWLDDKGIDTTVFVVDVENNEAHDGVEEGHQEKMKKDGFSGIIHPGIGYLGAYAYQPNTEETYPTKLSGSTVSSKLLANMLTGPQLTTEDLLQNENIKEADAVTNSSTLLSVIDSARQTEFEKATITAALVGGVFYIPEELIEQENISMLSYDPNDLDPKRYLCNEKSNFNNCPIIRATSGCSGVARASVSIRLRQIVLSAINDTDYYAGATAGSAKPQTEKVARSYTRAGHFFQGQFLAPQGELERASIDELVLLSGRGTPACTRYATDRYTTQPQRLSEIAQERVKQQLATKDYNYQSVLVSPINVRFRTWINYKVNLGLLRSLANTFPFSLIKSSILGLVRQGEYQSKEVTGDVIRPALISFKVDSLFRGRNMETPNSYNSNEVETQTISYLSRLNVKPMDDFRIECGDGPYGTPEYYLCSDSGNILTKCSTN